jgi:hypothetical protein
MRGKERTVTDEWALPSSDTGKKREKGGSGCWAGAAIGPATGFW